MDIRGGVTSIIPSRGSPDQLVSRTKTCNMTMILENGFEKSGNMKKTTVKHLEHLRNIL